MTGIGKKVSETALQMHGNNIKPGGKCLKGVQDILDKAGIVTQRVPHAYLFPTVAFKCKAFAENYTLAKSTRVDVSKLPPGSIIVYDREPGHDSGHIEIVTPKGFVSDYLQKSRAKGYASQKYPHVIYIPKL